MATLNVGGARLPENLAADVFYGFKLNPKTGHLSIEVIAQGDGVVRLPADPEIVQSDDYRQWLWSPDTLQFSFSTNGHLEMTVL